MMMASAGPQKRLTTEQYMVLQEALAISSALSAADHLGVLARLDAGPADSITIARDCAISERGVRLLLAALCSLGLIEEGSDGLYHAALPDLAQLTMWITPWSQLTQAIRDDQPARAGDTPGGAETLYPEVVAHLGAWFAPAAERAAGHLIALEPCSRGPEPGHACDGRGCAGSPGGNPASGSDQRLRQPIRLPERRFVHHRPGPLRVRPGHRGQPLPPVR